MIPLSRADHYEQHNGRSAHDLHKAELSIARPATLLIALCFAAIHFPRLGETAFLSLILLIALLCIALFFILALTIRILINEKRNARNAWQVLSELHCSFVGAARKLIRSPHLAGQCIRHSTAFVEILEAELSAINCFSDREDLQEELTTLPRPYDAILDNLQNLFRQGRQQGLIAASDHYELSTLLRRMDNVRTQLELSAIISPPWITQYPVVTILILFPLLSWLAHVTLGLTGPIFCLLIGLCFLYLVQKLFCRINTIVRETVVRRPF